MTVDVSTPTEQPADGEALAQSDSPRHAPSALEPLVARAGQLYSLPAVAMDVLRLTENPHVDVGEIKRCIERDPAMTAKILKVVNSPLFGLSGHVSDLNQALALLGIKPLKLLVLGFSLPKEMLQGIEAEALSQYWQFSLTKAVAAREIATLAGQSDGDEAFIAGLLSEIGTLVLLQELGDAYADFAAKVQAEEADLLQLELETIGFDHVILGCRLLQSWNLPQILIQRIRRGQPGPPLPLMTGPPSTLYLAHQLAEILVRQRLNLLPKFLDQLTAATQHDRKTVETLVIEVQAKLYQLADAMSVALPEGTDYTQIVTQAYTRLSVLAESAAATLALEDDAVRQKVAQSAEARGLIASVESLANRPASVKATAEDTQHEDRTSRPSPSTTPLLPTVLLLDELKEAIVRCRQQRSELSLLLLRVDHFDDLLMEIGPHEIDLLWQLVGAVANRLSDGLACVVSCGDDAMAVVLHDHDRQQGVSICRQILDVVAPWSRRRWGAATRLSLSGGVASVWNPPATLPSDELFDAARRCVLAACRGGGNSVKSIEMI